MYIVWYFFYLGTWHLAYFLIVCASVHLPVLRLLSPTYSLSGDLCETNNGATTISISISVAERFWLEKHLLQGVVLVGRKGYMCVHNSRLGIGVTCIGITAMCICEAVPS